MDILYLIDRLEEIVKEGKPVPFRELRLVNAADIWPTLDQMRIAIPDEVRRAERVIREKERTMAQAHEEAERIVDLARSEAARLASAHHIARSAEGQANLIRERAQRDADSVRSGADEYAFDVLCKLEQEMRRALTVIENGIRTIDVERERGRVRDAVQQEQEKERVHLYFGANGIG